MDVKNVKTLALDIIIWCCVIVFVVLFYSYEDLKPPSSPSPTPSGLKKITSDVSTPVEVASPSSGGNDAAKLVVDGVTENGPPKISTYSLSPFPA